MANNFLPYQTNSFSLSSAGVVVGATSFALKSFTDITTGASITMANLGTIAYVTFEPGTSNEEQISFTSISYGTGVPVMSGVMSVNFGSPYTSISGFQKTHIGGVTVVLSNTSAFYAQMPFLNNDNAYTQNNTFTIFPTIASGLPTLPLQFATKAYVDSVAVSGAPNATTAAKGIVQLSTQAQVDAKTVAGSTGASLVATNDQRRSTLLSDYVADTGAANAYVITPVPAITAYTTGQQFSFKALVTNTGASTLNVNGLGAKTITRANGSALLAGDIVAGEIVETNYDGTNFQILSYGSPPITTAQLKFGGTGSDGALTISSGVVNITLNANGYTEKNYTSISITGTGQLIFTGGGAAQGNVIVLRSQGAITITSATVPAINLKLLGQPVPGTAYAIFVSGGGAAPIGGGGGRASSSGIGGGINTGPQGTAQSLGGVGSGPLTPIMRNVTPGGGGYTGNTNFVGGQVGGAGGIGGAALYLECSGAYNCTSTIDASGQAGTNAVGSGAGGGGGGGGDILVLYNSLTSDTGTYLVTGGIGGTGGTGVSPVGGAGGAGGNGTALRMQNTYFL